MPKESAAVLSTDKQIAGAMPPVSGGSRAEYRIKGTPNLILRVTPDGTKSSVYRYKKSKTNGWHRFTIGHYPALSLGRARDEAVRLRQGLLDGSTRQRVGALTRQPLPSVVSEKSTLNDMRSPKSAPGATTSTELGREVYPVLGASKIKEVSNQICLGF